MAGVYAALVCRDQWNLVRVSESQEACEIRIDEGEALSFACFAGDVRGLSQ